MKWRRQLESGLYFNLLQRGFLKSDDLEPNIEGFEFYYDAFRELGTSRNIGLDVGPIPFTAIAEYFRIYQIPEDFDDFASIIRQMDNVYLDLNAKSKDAKGDIKSGADNANAKDIHKSRHKR